MPKLKTKKSVKKRFKITKTKKIKRQKAYHSHLAEKKSTKRKRHLRAKSEVSKPDRKRIKKLLHI